MMKGLFSHPENPQIQKILNQTIFDFGLKPFPPINHPESVRDLRFARLTIDH